jgi:hypothetical protein
MPANVPTLMPEHWRSPRVCFGVLYVGRTLDRHIDVARTGVSSGSFYAYPGNDPSRTADIGGRVITIGGVSQEIDGAANTSYLFLPAGCPNCAGTTTCVAVGTTSGAGRFGGSSSLSFDAGSFASGAPTSLFDVPTGGNLCERAMRCEGSFQFDESGEGLYGRLRLSSLTFSTASVPEPSTWMTMVLGFGLAGAAMRRDGPA